MTYNRRSSFSRVVKLLTWLTRDIHGSRNVRELLHKLLTRIMGLIGAQRGDFAIWNQERKELVIEAVYGPKTSTTLKVGDPVPRASFIEFLWNDRGVIHKISGNVSNKKHPYYRSNKKTRSEIAVRFEFKG